MAQRKKPTTTNRQPRVTPPAAAQSAPATTIAPEKNLMTTYLKPFILFVAAAAVILYLIAQAGNRGNDFPASDSAEAGFTRDMITHHAQAVQMSQIVRDRLPDDAPVALDQFLWDILSTQQNQIGQMEGWLDIWGVPRGSTEPPMAWMGHEVTGLMPGMATNEQIEELRTLPYEQMVVRFMELMIVHHNAAVEMGNFILDESDNAVVERLADAMVRTQAAEVGIMNDWIGKFGGASVTDGATPSASPVASPEHEH
jgi:uncharacterized protein (DUF305 family)